MPLLDKVDPFRVGFAIGKTNMKKQKELRCFKGGHVQISGKLAKDFRKVAKHEGITEQEVFNRLMTESLPALKMELMAALVLTKPLYRKANRVCQKLGVSMQEFIKQAVEDQTKDAIADTAVALCIQVAAGVRPASDWEADQAEYRARCSEIRNRRATQ